MCVFAAVFLHFSRSNKRQPQSNARPRNDNLAGRQFLGKGTSLSRPGFAADEPLTCGKAQALADRGAVLGIDVGCSEKRRSSAVCRLEWNPDRVNWHIERFRAVSEDRRRAIDSVAADIPLAAAAFDGSLRRGFGIIGHYRTAERMLTRRLQSKIGKPGQSSTPVGRRLNEAANACADAVRRRCCLRPATHRVRIDEKPLVEAFPSAFLGLMIADPARLPTERNSRSDVFFERLAASGALRQLVAHLLPGRELASRIGEVRNHDARAALVCALTALCVAAGEFAAAGDDEDGWIILPPRRFIQDWAWSDLRANANEEPSGALYVAECRGVNSL